MSGSKFEEQNGVKTDWISGEKELNLIVETKDVESKSSLRGDEAAKIECAKVFFENLSLDGYKVYFRDQLNNKQMVQIVREVVGNSRNGMDAT